MYEDMGARALLLIEMCDLTCYLRIITEHWEHHMEKGEMIQQVQILNQALVFSLWLLHVLLLVRWLAVYHSALIMKVSVFIRGKWEGKWNGTFLVTYRLGR